MKVWSRTLRSEGVTPKETEEDAAEARARAAFGACVSAINAVDSLSYRFAEVRLVEDRRWMQRAACVLHTKCVFCTLTYAIWSASCSIRLVFARAGCEFDKVKTRAWWTTRSFSIRLNINRHHAFIGIPISVAAIIAAASEGIYSWTSCDFRYLS